MALKAKASRTIGVPFKNPLLAAANYVPVVRVEDFLRLMVFTATCSNWPSFLLWMSRTCHSSRFMLHLFFTSKVLPSAHKRALALQRKLSLPVTAKPWFDLRIFPLGSTVILANRPQSARPWHCFPPPFEKNKHEKSRLSRLVRGILEESYDCTEAKYSSV